jgi:hypothetical protein
LAPAPNHEISSEERTIAGDVRHLMHALFEAASDSTAAPASTLNTQALLVQFLTNLQTDLGLGYGGSTGAPAQSATSGVMVNTAA